MYQIVTFTFVYHFTSYQIVYFMFILELFGRQLIGKQRFSWFFSFVMVHRNKT